MRERAGGSGEQGLLTGSTRAHGTRQGANVLEIWEIRTSCYSTDFMLIFAL